MECLDNGAVLCASCNTFVIPGDAHPRWCKPAEERDASETHITSGGTEMVILGEEGVSARFDLNPDSVEAFRAGSAIGERRERRRIASALDALERKAASLFFEGAPSQRAVAGYVAEVRKIVEGEGK